MFNYSTTQSENTDPWCLVSQEKETDIFGRNLLYTKFRTPRGIPALQDTHHSRFKNKITAMKRKKEKSWHDINVHTIHLRLT